MFDVLVDDVLVFGLVGHCDLHGGPGTDSEAGFVVDLVLEFLHVSGDVVDLLGFTSFFVEFEVVRKLSHDIIG